MITFNSQILQLNMVVAVLWCDDVHSSGTRKLCRSERKTNGPRYITILEEIFKGFKRLEIGGLHPSGQ